MGVDDRVSVEKFCKKLKTKISRLTEVNMEFDMNDIDVLLANAFRRILVTDVCTLFVGDML